jgi:hypothetical protein
MQREKKADAKEDEEGLKPGMNGPSEGEMHELDGRRYEDARRDG